MRNREGNSGKSRWSFMIGLVLAGACIAFVSQTALAVGAGQPIVTAGGTILTATGQRMRGTPINIKKSYGPAVNDWAKDINNLRKARDEAHYNLFRLCLIDGQHINYNWSTWYTVNEALTQVVDTIVKNAEALGGIYLMVDFHSPFRNWDQTQADWNVDNFWKTVAPRYKDKSFVMYEVFNEGSGCEGPTPGTVMYDWVPLRNSIRNAAPNNVIIHGSPACISGNRWGPWLRDDFAKQGGFNWAGGKDAFGFHGYESGLTPDVIKGIQACGVPIIMTEVGYVGAEWSGYQLGPYTQQFEWYERNGVSWVDWHDWQKTDPLKNAMTIGIPDALAKGYAWWLQAAAQPLANGYRDNGISHTSRPGYRFDSMGRCIVYSGDKGRGTPLTPSHTAGKLTKTR